MRIRVVLLFLLPILASPLGRIPTAVAQDAHYWNLQYGTRAELLGGAVIGSKVGLSNTFYNPGALGLLERPSLVLSSLAFELTTYELPNSAIEDKIGSTSLRTVPNFVAGTLWFGVLGSGRLAYSFLTRQEFDVRFKLRGLSESPGVGAAPDTTRAAEALVEGKVNENWTGLTWSRASATGIGLGFTTYIAYRSQRSRKQAVGQEYYDDGLTGSGQSENVINEFNYWHVRTLTKLGAMFERDTYSLGLTVTTPSLGLFGGGSTYSSTFIPQDSGPPISAASFQKDIDPDYRSSWAVGGGGSIRYKNTRFHGSLEWYQKIDRREVLASDSFQEASTGSTLSNSAVLELDSVTNFGIGVEHILNPTVQIYLSYNTNFSALPEKTDANLAVSSWNINQITAGSNFEIKHVEFTLGLEYGFGRDTIDRLEDIGLSESEGLIVEVGQQEVRYRRLEFFLGFTFLFGDDPVAKPKGTIGRKDS